jgi:large subunit ribosomal protein L22
MVADLVRGKDVETALNQLHFSNKKAAEWIEKTVRSAVSNLMTLEGGAGVSPEDLFVKTILVDAGATVKRFRAGSMGRASIIRKRSSHISVTIAEKKDKVGKNQKKK